MSVLRSCINSWMKSIGVILALVVFSVEAAGQPAPDRDYGAELAAAIQTKRIDALTAFIADSVEIRGVWFPDAACAQRFGADGTVTGAARGELARCLAKLTPQFGPETTKIKDRHRVLLTYEPGVEIDFHLVKGRIAVVGLTRNGGPSLSPTTFDGLRTSGSQDVNAAVRDRLDPVIKASGGDPISALLLACIDTRGAVQRVELKATNARGADKSVVQKAFEAAIRTWKFRPFSPYGTAISACSHTFLRYPAMALKITPDGLLAPPGLVAKLRIQGEHVIVPDEPTQSAMWKAGNPRVTASFKLCLDISGVVTKIQTLKSTGYPAYDAKIQSEMRNWRYRSYLLDGKAVPVCTAVTLVYTQQAPQPKP